MGDGSLIGWTDATWPVVVGCEHVSPGCDHCWSAFLTSGRLSKQPTYAGLATKGRFTGEVRILYDRLNWPLKWRKPRRIFVCSASDLFHKGVPDDFIADVFATMALAPQHIFQVLTKRAGRMRSVLNNPEFQRAVHFAVLRRSGGQASYPEWPLPNAHLGVSAEDQKWFDVRVRALLDTPAAVRWVSAEPLLGPVRLTPDDHTGHERDWDGSPGYNCLDCSTEDELVPWYEQEAPPGLGWIVVGGESGPHYRHMELSWLTRLVDDCRKADIPVYVKQDSGRRAGQQGRIPDDYWVHQFPAALTVTPEAVSS